MIGQLLTTWTIRLALGCYAAFLAGELAGPRFRAWSTPRWDQLARGLWTAGCALFVAHVVLAMGTHHHWNHWAAIAETARRTKELMGVAFGGGLYFSYLFMLVWVADVASWWLLGERYRERPRWLALLVHGYLAFIAFNGAIVFESGPTRWLGIPICLALAALFVARVWTADRRTTARIAAPRPAPETES